MPDLSVYIGKLKLKNPVMVCSGTFGYASEFEDLMDLKVLGAIVTKTITLNPRQGNPSPRTCETPSGMLNSIGLENPGFGAFVSEKLPYLKKTGIPVIVSIASEKDPREFVTLARALDKVELAAAIELNISCPNIRHKGAPEAAGKLISQDPKATFEVVKAVRKATGKMIITKLSPNVTDIAQIGIAAQKAGSDAVSLINTLGGMSIDIRTSRPKIAMVSGGLSGPAIRPVAVKMTWDAYQKLKIPIIGMGGITDTASALEFIMAGAKAVAVGTQNFVDPKTCQEIISGIKGHMIANNIKNMNKLTGSVKIG